MERNELEKHLEEKNVFETLSSFLMDFNRVNPGKDVHKYNNYKEIFTITKSTYGGGTNPILQRNHSFTDLKKIDFEMYEILLINFSESMERYGIKI